MTKNILQQNTNENIDFFTEIIRSVLRIDYISLRKIAIQTIKYSTCNKENKIILREGQELELRWYESIESESPDYGVYDHPYYLSELLACWIVYSKKYIKNLVKLGLFPKKINRIVDLGCGIGFSTLALKQFYPDADVFGTNIKNTIQFSICDFIAKTNNFKVIENIDQIGKADIVFASEYFEHIDKPLDHLADVIEKLDPAVIYSANSFNARAIGHFPFYIINDERIENKKVGKIFNTEMRIQGFGKIETKLWNSRPTYWRKK